MSRGTGLLLFGLAVLTRAAYLFIYRPTLESYYLGLADSLVHTGVLGFGGRPSTDFEPVYPSFLAAGRLMFGHRVVLIQLLQVSVAASGAALLYQLALHLSSSQRTATIAGALFALHPLLIRQSSSASDLPVTTTLLVAFALVFVRIRSVRDAALAGLVVGITVLTRSMAMPVVAFGAAILLIREQRQHAAALALASAITIAPMVARTYLVSGTLAPTRSGVNLYIGNSPHTAALLPTYDLDLLEPEAYERFVRARPDINPDDRRFGAELDAFLTVQAMKFIGENPLVTLRQKLLNVGYLVSPRIAPLRISGRDTRVIIDDNGAARVADSVARSPVEVWSHAAAASLLLAGTIAGLVLRRRHLHRDAILWAVAGTFIAVNALYVPATRYASPMLFVMIFYTAVALGGQRGEFGDGRFTR